MDPHQPDHTRTRLADESISMMTRAFHSKHNAEAARLTHKIIDQIAPALLREDRATFRFTSTIPILSHPDCRRLSEALNIYALVSAVFAGANAGLEDRTFYIKLLYAASRLNPRNIKKRFDLASMVYSTLSGLDKYDSIQYEEKSALRDALLNLGQAAIRHLLGATKEERSRVMSGECLHKAIADHRRTPNILAFGVCFYAWRAVFENERNDRIAACEAARQGLRYAELNREVLGLPRDRVDFLKCARERIERLDPELRFALKAGMKSEQSLLQLIGEEQQAIAVAHLLAQA